MTSATATLSVTTKFIEMPANRRAGDWVAALLRADGTTAAQSFGPSLPLAPINVSLVPSGTYTLRVSRRDTDLGVISSSSATVVLDQTVEVPDVVTVTLA